MRILYTISPKQSTLPSLLVPFPHGLYVVIDLIRLAYQIHVGDLVDWCNTKFMARIRSEYKAKQSPNRRKPDCGRIRRLAVSAQIEIKKLAAAMENIDCLILADTLGRDGLVELKGRLGWIESQIDNMKSTIGDAWEFV